MPSVLARSNTTRPIKQFIYIDLPQTVDAFNELVNDVNAQIAILDAMLVGSQFPPFTVAGLPPSGGLTGFAFATDGRKISEGHLSGTGIPVYYDSASNRWLTFSLDQPVAA